MRLKLIGLILCACIVRPLFSQEIVSENAQALERFRHDLQQLKQLRGLEGASVAWSFRRLADAKELEAYNAGQMLLPASTIKVYTSIAALDVLGPDYRYETQLIMAGELHGNRLAGDFVLKGSGDPSSGHLDQQVLTALSKGIAQAGIEKVRGKLLADPWALPYNYAAIPRDRTWEDMANYFGSGVYGLNWSNNSLAIRFKSSTPAAVTMEQPDSIAWEGKISNLVVPGITDDIYFFPQPFSGDIQVAGTLSSKNPARSERMALPHPPLQFVSCLHDTLKQHDIRVKKGFEVLDTAYQLQKGDSVLVKYFSAPLGTLLKEVNQKSNNLYAEAIARTTGLKLGSDGTAEDACRKIRQHLVIRKLAADTLFELREGSGLGRKNLVTAGGMTKLLQIASTRQWFADFEASLATPGNQGTLRSFKTIKGLKAKTGSLTGVRAYTGYFEDQSGQRIAFAIILNNYLDGSLIKSQVEKVLESASRCVF